MHNTSPGINPEACRAAAQLGRTVNRALEDGPLTPAAYRLLAYLSSGGVAATILADKLAVSRPSVTATTDWLVERGLATRATDPSDRRRVAIAMTAKGAKALKEADGLVAHRLTEVLGALPDDDVAQITRALEQLLGALNDYRVTSHLRRNDARHHHG